MMVAEHSYPRYMMEQNSLSPSFCIPSWKHKENGAPLNKELVESTMPLPSGSSQTTKQVP